MPLQDAALDGVSIDCADGKVRWCFPVLSPWVADHMENVALHGIKSNACPKCEVAPDALGTDAEQTYPARDYAIYERLEQENQHRSTDSTVGDIDATFDALGIKMGQNVFHGLHGVSAPDLH